MKGARRARTLRNGVAVTDADVVTGYASQRLLWIGIVTDRECKPLTFGLFDNVACLNDRDADMDTDTCTDSLPQFIWCWLKVKLWPGHMCTKFQINRSTIDDFRNSEKCQLYWRHVTKNVTSYVIGASVLPKRLSTENILQPTRSLYDVWLKSYGSLCVFHVWVILTLTFDLSRSLFMCGVNIYPLVSTNKYWKFSVSEFLWYDCTLKNQCTVCVTLTYDLWRSIILCELIIRL